ncbi:probable L-asparaginase periplasmic isoform X2 [Asterias rubens]|uniref:probable L-asparaginase periplasmic isoform X2 n=1 Tax=Asterias rubens TaxID=7604 RepID=UPI0014550C62|nr:probable L-asparaginase periplasmic isoform X2 [Asterias rubens]
MEQGQPCGTIDKDYPHVKGGYAFEIGESAVMVMMQRIRTDVTFEYQTVCRKDSQDIDDDDRELLWKTCQQATQKTILITHGTDTMIETAAYLAKRRLPNKNIVLTGAFLPATFKKSEAEFNIGVALGALQCLTECDVYIAMTGRVLRWDKVTRDNLNGKCIAILKG